MTFVHQCGKTSSRDKAKARKMSQMSSQRMMLPAVVAAIPRSQVFRRSLLLTGVSAAALAMSVPGAYAKSMGGWTPVPTAAAVAAAQTNSAEAAAAARRSLNALQQATSAIQAMRATQQAARDAARAALARTPSGIADGLKPGGLEPVVNPSQWIGGNLDGPTSTKTDDGRTKVTVEQTQQRAIFTWNKFNVSENTDLVFNQLSAEWVALNRVLDTAPSKILGSIKAPGTVLVINQNGIVFGGGSQINVGSLYASTLEVGPGLMPNPNTATGGYIPSTIEWRTQNFINNGLTGYEPPAGTFFGTGNSGSATFSAFNGSNAGTVRVENGATITAGDSGLILLTAPHVINAGYLRAPQGQVILTAAELALTLTPSSGNGSDPTRRYDWADGSFTGDHVWASPDSDVRGVVPLPQGVNASASDYYVWNQSTGLIEAPQGNIYLRSPGSALTLQKGYSDAGGGGTTIGFGAAYNDGILSTSTSVSRNGSIIIQAGDVRLRQGSLLSILPDVSNETIPQAPSSLAAFKPSAIKIVGGQNTEMESGSFILAPGGNVQFGPTNGLGNLYTTGVQSIVIDAGAEINVAGLADVFVPISDNQVFIDPAKKNELRDTPIYRVGFLNGATVYLDPRVTGVRDDGVAWIGSPLIDAAAYYQLVGVGADRLMTKGGSVTFGTTAYSGSGTFSSALVRNGAVIDISGGWLRYEGGVVRTTQLIDKSGRIVDISNADPHGDFESTYVGIYNGWIRNHPQWGVVDTWSSSLSRYSNGHYMPEFTEGKDAGALRIVAPAMALDGTLLADAYAGAMQTASGKAGTGTPSISGDQRRIQGSGSELPAGGALILYPTGEVKIVGAEKAAPLPGDGVYGAWTSGGISSDTGAYTRPTANGQPLPADRLSTLLISDDLLSKSGLSQVSILSTIVTPSQTPLSVPDTRTAYASITVDSSAHIALAAGGIFQAEGTRIQIDGDITVPSGKIVLRTDQGLPAAGPLTIIPTYHPGDFDIVINGDLSVAGRWVNDLGATSDSLVGPGWLDGGTISMIAAPRVQARVSQFNPAGSDPTDVSGSILIGDGAHLNLSSGGRVDPNGKLVLTAKGGNLTLVNESAYFLPAANSFAGFQVPACGYEMCYTPSNPTQINSRILFNPGNIDAHGFGGGGTFTLTTPEFSFGTGTAQAGAMLPLDFFSTAGFANYAITSYKTALIPSQWIGYPGTDSVLAMQTLTIGAGQNLSLVQSVLPTTALTASQSLALRDLASGGDIRGLVKAYVPNNAYEQKALNLTLGGAMELHVAQGGSVTGAAGSSLTIGGLVNEGLIRIAGGTITQKLLLNTTYVNGAGVGNGIGIHNYSDVFTINPDGTIDPNAPSKVLHSDGSPVLNKNLVGDFRGSGPLNTNDARGIYLLGMLDQGQGVVLAPGSITDLSGAVLRDPLADGRAMIDGRIIGGGAFVTSAAQSIDSRSFTPNGYQLGQQFIALAGAEINLAGASGTINQPTLNGYVQTPVWSNGGMLSLGAGGTLAGATINAHGGNGNAVGGTLQMLRPIFAQHDSVTQTANVISSDMIDASGFSSVVAVGGFGSSGDATINLDRGLFVIAAPWSGISNAGTDDARANAMAPVISANGALTISAPYIGLQSAIDDAASANSGTLGGGSVTLHAGQIDIAGAIRFDNSVANATLWADGDLRLIGVDQSWKPSVDLSNPTLKGSLLVRNDLEMRAGQIYPTTGSSFVIASPATNGTITFSRSSNDAPAAPYTAGASLVVQAANIVQAGVLRVPFGSLTLGGNAPLSSASSASIVLAPATKTVTLADGSITSVSANGLSIPYGTTTDTIEWYFSPTNPNALGGPPVKVMRLAGDKITLGTGAVVDLSGGGDVYGYEFVPGTGGSRDVLSQFNSDQYSANFINGVGYQYPDGRQVYAIVPGLSDKIAAVYDPIYSANYTSLLSASGTGRRVYLSGGNGVSAGWYTLLPAQYAMLPGGMRVVEQTGVKDVMSGSSVKLGDGTIVVSGRYGDALSGAFDSQVRQFSVMSQDVIKSYSSIVLTSGNDWTLRHAAANGDVAPRVGLDAGRLILAPLSEMTVDATMRNAPAEGGRGSQVDIAGTVIDIVSTSANAGITPGSIVLSAESLNNLKAESLLVGGTRTDNTDGTTTLNITSTSIIVANDSEHALIAPEIVLAVDDGTQKVNGVVTPVASRLELRDGATIVATGAMSDQRSGAYLIDARVQFISNPVSDGNDHYNTAGSTGIGALVRVANGPQRLVQRLRSPNNPDLPGVIGTPDGPDASLTIGSAYLHGSSVALDTSHALSIGNAAQIIGKDIALGGSAIAFSSTPQPANTIVITPNLLATLSQGERLTLHSQTSIGFDEGIYSFKTIRFDAATLKSFDGGDVTINADRFEIGNVSGPGTTAGGIGHLTVNAGEIAINTGTVVTDGFGAGVNLNASKGLFSTGVASVLDVGAASLTVNTPYIGDRSTPGVVANAATALTLKTTGDIAISSAGMQPLDLAGDPGISGSAVTIDGRSVSIAGTTVRATSGVLNMRASNGIALSDGAVLIAPGFAQTYGDTTDPQTKYAPGGLISLVAGGASGLSLGDATLSVGNGKGNAGTLKLSAANGVIDWGTASLDGKGGDGGKGGTFSIDTGGGFDLVALNTKVGAYGFTGGFDVRTRTGDLVLGSGQLLKSGSVNLTADGGFVVISGVIDTSGVEGGDIALYGASGVTLQATARLDATATGYAIDDTRQASAGNVTLGTGFVPGTTAINANGSVTGASGRISVAAGALIDVSAKRPGDRLVRLMRNGTINYAYVGGDKGGVVRLRAPVKDNGFGSQTVDVSVASAASVVGAREVDLVGFKRWDLPAVAASALYTGVESNAGTVALDVRTGLDSVDVNGNLTPVAGLNFLGDYGAGTVAQFAQDFNLAAAYGNLGGLAAKAGFSARPGIDLTAPGDIVLASNWNLGAGSVDLAAATAAGDMVFNPRLVTTGIATSGYIVVPGREGDIIDRFTRLTYRPGRSARAGAPVVSLLAGGTLDLRGSVTDGFFTFRDQTDPAYRNQNGATYNAYNLTLSGGINNGALTSALPDWSTWAGYSLPSWYLALSVGSSLTTYLSQRSETIDSSKIPYSATGNSPAALGNLAGGGGDPVASAQIFPLLPDGAVVASSSYNLVAGSARSTDPARVNSAAAAALKAGGYTTYQTAGGSYTTGTIVNGLSVDGNSNYTTARPLATDGQRSLADWLAWITGPTATGVKDTSIAVLYLGNTAVRESPARTLVKSLFTSFLADHPELLPDTGYRYSSATATLDNTTFIAMPVNVFKQFVASYLISNQSQIEAALRNQQADGSFLDNYITKPTFTTSVPASPVTMARSLIRTGTGAINLAAAGNVDLTGGPIVYVTQTGAISATTPAQTPAGGVAPSQVGGVPVYTAGHPAVAINELLPDPVTGDLVSVVSPAGTPAVSVFANPRQYFTYGLTVPTGTGNGTRRDPAGVMVADTYNLTDGGDVIVSALGNILSRRDLALTQSFQNIGAAALSVPWAGVANRPLNISNGLPDQLWRVVSLTSDGILNTSINPQLFREGLGALGGGNIRVRAGGSVSDITSVVDTSNTSVRTALPDGTLTNLLVTVGGGDIAMRANADIAGVRVHAGSGAVQLSALGNIADGDRIAVNTGSTRPYFDTLGIHYSPVATNYLTNESLVVIDDATVDMEAGGTISLSGIGQLSGFYSDHSALNLLANGSVTVTNTQQVMGAQGATFGLGSYGIYPGTLTVSSVTGDIDLKTLASPPGYNPQSGIAITPAQQASYNVNSPTAILLVPSPDGQLSLLAGHNVGKTNIAMLDADPYYLPGLYSLGGSLDFTSSALSKAPNAAYQWGSIGFPSYSTKLTDTQLRRQHNATITHINDPLPAYIYAGNDIGSAQSGMKLWLPKQARVYAGRDLLNMMFFGQNLQPTDITRIVAGRDIAATSILGTAYLSQTATRIAPVMLGNTFILGGPGDFMVEAGRDLGPFLNSADIADTTYNSKLVLRYPGGIVATGNEWNPYLPSESASITVQFGVAKGADYSALRDAYVKPGSDAWAFGSYGPKLLEWMKNHAKDTLVAKYGTTAVTAEDAYAAFVTLPELRQRDFLLNQVFFSELRAPADPAGPSYLKYSRGYIAVNTLFPSSLGYTANGLDGGDKAEMVHTGDLDLRLATIETLYGGGINILGPGGRVVAGSVVSTAQQITRRNYTYGLFNPNTSLTANPILAVPTGYEGVLTQRGGAINTFTDGDFLLNQSRLFTVDGDDITMWSSNADLNGGQGAKTTPNFPPVLVRLNQDLVVRDDRTGSTTGAGIAAFPSKDKTKRPPVVSLEAPRGTVDAGDAGVRSAGDINVAALTILNADNFRAAGSTSGIPTVTAPNVGGLSEASNAAGQAAKQIGEQKQENQAQPSIIIVEVLGFGGGSGDANDDEQRKKRQ